MKRFLMTLAAVLCCAIIAFAQSERNQIFKIKLGEVKYAHHGEKMSTGDAVGKVISGVLTGKSSVQATQYEQDATSAIARGLSTAYRFRYDNNLLQADDASNEGNVVVDAVIINLQTSSSGQSLKETLDDKSKYKPSTLYKGLAEVMLTLKDARSGDAIATHTIKGEGTSLSSSSTSDKAIQSALERLSHNIAAWLNSYRPLSANIVESGAAKKDKQKEVYIDLGRNEGAFAGLQMGVFVVKTVAGREAKSQIGKLKVEAVEGEDISRCKVQSGAKEIKAAIDEGKQLQVVSIN